MTVKIGSTWSFQGTPGTWTLVDGTGVKPGDVVVVANVTDIDPHSFNIATKIFFRRYSNPTMKTSWEYKNVFLRDFKPFDVLVVTNPCQEVPLNAPGIPPPSIPVKTCTCSPRALLWGGHERGCSYER